MDETPFIDRIEEKQSLIESLNRSGAELIILYGRRRIGKSRLLKEVQTAVPIDIFIMLEDTTYQENLMKMARAVSTRFGFPSFSPTSFKEIFLALPAKSIIIIDEFSYLGDRIGEFQAIWEEIAKPHQLKIILSGSLIRVMEDMAFSLKSPRYGQRRK